MDNHVSFGNIVFGLASAQPSTGFVGCAEFVLFVDAVLSVDATKVALVQLQRYIKRMIPPSEF